MSLGLHLGLRLGAGAVGAFSPASLFTAGESGYWLDPSDFSTMFQDAAGATPVTATGQSVRLMLDKSKGLVLGPELIPSLNLADNAVWSTAGTLSAITANSFTNTSGSGAGRQSSVIVTSGKTFSVSVSYSKTNAGVSFAVFANSGISFTSSSANSGTLTCIIPATANQIYLRLSGNDTVTVNSISVRELPGNHFTQANVANAPILQQDAGGNYFLLFDGTDDWLQSAATINPGAVDKAQVFAGVRKLSDAARGMIVESSVNAGVNAGAFLMDGPGITPASESYRYVSNATLTAIASAGGAYPAPITNVLTGTSDISGDSAILRVNGTQVASNTADQGTGNYLTYTHYIGRRGGTTLPYNGRIYQMVMRYGANLTAGQITQTETFVNSKTGAY